MNKVCGVGANTSVTEPVEVPEIVHSVTEVVDSVIEEPTYAVVEQFVSIDGEGPTAGALSHFIRLAGCNLRCVWCDTCYAQTAQSAQEYLTLSQLVDSVKQAGIAHVTLTGGEPLLRPHVKELLQALSFVTVHVETNGSINVEPFRVGEHVHFVVDYKLPSSGMEHTMCLQNFDHVTPTDAYKFVIADAVDMQKAVALVKQYNLTHKTQVYFSTVFAEMTPADVVEVMKQEKLNGVKLQLQLHKYIWNPLERGV
jgi:7-carboxy-7-deazaguanine synthase